MKAIVNPAAGRGRAGARWPALRRALGDRLDEAILTTRPGEATPLTRAVLRNGCERVLAVGGDGTFSEVVNGFFDDDGQPINSKAVLAPVTCGTGGDFSRTAGTPVLGAGADAEGVARHLCGGGRVRTLDVGRVTYTGADGASHRRHFLNVASLGMGAAVVQRVRQTALPGWVGGTAVFFLAIARVMLRYRNTPVALAVDGRPVGRYRVRSVAVANGRFFGSGLKVAPHARPNDGKLDTVVVGDLSRTGFVRHIGKLYAGTHLALDEVYAFRGRTVTATSDEEVRLDIDGEPIGRLPATFEVRPAALRVLCGETAAF